MLTMILSACTNPQMKRNRTCRVKPLHIRLKKKRELTLHNKNCNGSVLAAILYWAQSFPSLFFCSLVFTNISLVTKNILLPCIPRVTFPCVLISVDIMTLIQNFTHINKTNQLMAFLTKYWGHCTFLNASLCQHATFTLWTLCQEWERLY